MQLGTKTSSIWSHYQKFIVNRPIVSRPMYNFAEQATNAVMSQVLDVSEAKVG